MTLRPPKDKTERSADHGYALLRLCNTLDPGDYERTLKFLRDGGWDIRKTPRCDDMQAAREALTGALS